MGMLPTTPVDLFLSIRWAMCLCVQLLGDTILVVAPCVLVRPKPHSIGCVQRRPKH
jgi:hypothetical protein